MRAGTNVIHLQNLEEAWAVLRQLRRRKSNRCFVCGHKNWGMDVMVSLPRENRKAMAFYYLCPECWSVLQYGRDREQVATLSEAVQEEIELVLIHNERRPWPLTPRRSGIGKS